VSVSSEQDSAHHLHLAVKDKARAAADDLEAVSRQLDDRMIADRLSDSEVRAQVIARHVKRYAHADPGQQLGPSPTPVSLDDLAGALGDPFLSALEPAAVPALSSAIAGLNDQVAQAVTALASKAWAAQAAHELTQQRQAEHDERHQQRLASGEDDPGRTTSNPRPHRRSRWAVLRTLDRS
jgi:hypothetical protein